jgi:hypothetical protein
MTIGDEVTGAIATTHHDPSRVLHSAKNAIEVGERVVQLIAIQ